MDKSAKQMLAWLDRKRDEVNEQIIHAAPDEQGAWMPELQVINAIAERVQEMTAVEFVDAWGEICKQYGCDECPLSEDDGDCSTRSPSNALSIVKKWKEEQDGH